MKLEQVHELIYQSLEHEMGGVNVYETAVRCSINEDLKEEWEKYVEQTKTHVQRLHDVCDAFSLDPTLETPGRAVVHAVGMALVDSMRNAMAAGPDAAQLVACEAVTLAETKDHLDWELLGKCAENLTGDSGQILRAACEEVENEEDEHLYHTKGWCRELWIQSLGLPAVLPPPEEEHHVKTAIGASRAEQASEKDRKSQLSRGAKMVTRKTPSRKSTAKKVSTRKSTTSAGRKTPAKKTGRQATSAKRTAKKAAARKSPAKTAAQKKVKKVMHERKAGTLRSGSGKKVTSRKQAIAIGLSEARRAGAKVPRKG